MQGPGQLRKMKFNTDGSTASVQPKSESPEWKSGSSEKLTYTDDKLHSSKEASHIRVSMESEDSGGGDISRFSIKRTRYDQSSETSKMKNLIDCIHSYCTDTVQVSEKCLKH